MLHTIIMYLRLSIRLSNQSARSEELNYDPIVRRKAEVGKMLETSCFAII